MDEIKFPKLKYMMECYFHQMWPEAAIGISGKSEDIVIFEEFARTEAKQTLTEIITEIKVLVLEKRSESELEILLRDKFDGNVLPSVDGLTWNEWLLNMKETFEAC